MRAAPAHAREYPALTGFVENIAHVAKEFAIPTAELLSQARAELHVMQSLFPAANRPDLIFPHRSTGDAAFECGRPSVASPLRSRRLSCSVHGGYTIAPTTRLRSRCMPDGSTVRLSSDSEIKVMFDDDCRQVDLIRGQALFQVAKNPRRPFWVRAGDAVVKEVGIELDVHRAPQGTVISVVIFDHDPLGRAIEEFNRYDELRIRIDDPTSGRRRSAVKLWTLPDSMSPLGCQFLSKYFVRCLSLQGGMGAIAEFPRLKTTRFPELGTT